MSEIDRSERNRSIQSINVRDLWSKHCGTRPRVRRRRFSKPNTRRDVSDWHPFGEIILLYEIAILLYEIAILLLSTRCIRLTSFCTSPLQNFSTYVYVHHFPQCKYFNEKSSNLHSLTRFASQCLPISMEYSRVFTNALENTECAHCNSRKCYRTEKATSTIMWSRTERRVAP